MELEVVSGELERLDADVVALVFAQGDELPETIRDAPGAADCKPDFKKARPRAPRAPGAGSSPAPEIPPTSTSSACG